MRPNIFKSSLFAALLYASSLVGSAYAIDINLPGFTGRADHTVTSGFSMRVADYDCNLYTGYTYSESSISSGVTSITRGNGQGCTFQGNTPKWVDSFGNTATKYNQYHGSQPNSDNGSLNFDQGSIFSAKQKIFGSITGSTSDGLGVDISYSASVNPALDINAPDFKDLTSSAKEQFETDITLFDAYLTGSTDTADGGFIDYQIGRFATNWGEATFIPVGANGLVTNALDLSKLRGPGASIREALMPTEQITLSTEVDGISIEGYYQFDSKEVQLDPSGSYFGSDFVGKGSGPIIVGGAYDFEVPGGTACALSQQTGTTCDAASLLASRTQNNTVLNTINVGLSEMANNANGITLSQSQFGITTMGSASGDNNLSGDLIDNTVLIAGSAALGISAGSHTAASTQTGAGTEIMYTAGSSEFTASLAREAAKDADGSTQIAGIAALQADQKHIYAEDGGEYGVRFGTYLADVGTGVDLSVYFANYHSKAPYVRFKGSQGVFAGDYYAMYRAVVTDNLIDGYNGTALDALDGALTANGGDTLYTAIKDTAYGGTVCSAVLAGAVGSATLNAASGGELTLTKYTISDQQKALYMDRTFGTSIDGERALAHNSALCLATVDTIDAATNGSLNDANFAAELTASLILGAITPLNSMQHQFIYPEDNQIVGASFSTNVGSTTVQGEVSYRIDFPLATPASSQINQIADASGATQVLNWLAYSGLNGLGTNTSRGLGAADSTDATGDQLQAVLWATQTATDVALSDANAYENAVRDFKRSSLPSISQATVIASDYYSTPFINYDVLSVDIGTTTSFTASDPITVGLGADSAALLTEIAAVSIQSLDNSKGYVARGGYSASGDDPLKCRGAVGTTNTPTAGLGSVLSLGASIYDGLFGNGGYCEGQPGADATSFSYRIVGTATYNNFANSRWALSPNFAFAHDPKGYGPSSLGGFVEGRMSLSLGLNASSGGTTVGFSYVDNMGDEDVGTTTDRDYITASISHSF